MYSPPLPKRNSQPTPSKGGDLPGLRPKAWNERPQVDFNSPLKLLAWSGQTALTVTSKITGWGSVPGRARASCSHTPPVWSSPPSTADTRCLRLGKKVAVECLGEHVRSLSTHEKRQRVDSRLFDPRALLNTKTVTCSDLKRRMCSWWKMISNIDTKAGKFLW